MLLCTSHAHIRLFTFVSPRTRDNIIMAPKRKDVKISRRWTEEELDIFAEILADTDNGFARLRLLCLHCTKKFWNISMLSLLRNVLAC